MQKSKIYFLLFLVSILLMVVFGYFTKSGILKERDKQKKENDKVKVVTTFYPLAEFTRNVGVNSIEVVNLTPTGAEPHDYEPTPQDIIQIRQANIFIYNGAGIDAWAEKVAEDMKNEKVKVINMRTYIDLLKGIEDEDVHKEEDTSGFDPHYWLDPVIAQKEVEVIKDTLVKVDPNHAGEYEKNSKEYIRKLESLHQKYQQGLANCQQREFVVSHNAFGYLAKRYNLTIIPISGLSPEEEPSAKRIAKIAQLAKEKNIQYIFFETLLNPKLSETIAREIGAQTLVFNPIEGLTEEEMKEGKNYVTVMKDNLNNLRIALSCQ